jgi:hypothetical protein
MSSTLTRLETLRLEEISGVDDPANRLPGWMVTKAVGGAATVLDVVKSIIFREQAKTNDAELVEKAIEMYGCAVPLIADGSVEVGKSSIGDPIDRAAARLLKACDGSEDLFKRICDGTVIPWRGVVGEGLFKTARHPQSGKFYIPPVAKRETALALPHSGAPLPGKTAPVNLDTTGLKPTDNASPLDGDTTPDDELGQLLAAYPDAIEALGEGDGSAHDSLIERLRQKLQPTKSAPDNVIKIKSEGKPESLKQRNVRKAHEGLVELLGDVQVAKSMAQDGWFVDPDFSENDIRLYRTSEGKPINAARADALEAVGFDVKPNSGDHHIYLQRRSAP